MTSIRHFLGTAKFQIIVFVKISQLFNCASICALKRNKWPIENNFSLNRVYSMTFNGVRNAVMIIANIKFIRRVISIDGCSFLFSFMLSKHSHPFEVT